MISPNDLRNILRHRIEAAGGHNKWCQQNDLNSGYVSLALNGKIGLGAKIATALGYQKKVVYLACNSENEGA
jgi:hypothetical protein